MASAEELIREAQFAFHNVGPGSTDEKRNRALAKKFAMRVLRKYPVSAEAEQARAILSQLKIEYALAADTAPVARQTQQPDAIVPQATADDGRAFAIQGGDSRWMDVWQQFSDLPKLQKNIIWSVLIFLLFFFAFTPFLFIFLILLLTKRDALRDLLHKALVSMHPDAPGNRRRRNKRGR